MQKTSGTFIAISSQKTPKQEERSLSFVKCVGKKVKKVLVFPKINLIFCPHLNQIRFKADFAFKRTIFGVDEMNVEVNN